jgi:farnesyl-diphosphate farnesyltransferase
LQLVNILRDLPADLRAGRCYLPADELAAAGCDLGKPSKEIIERWIARAMDLLNDGFRYIEATRSARLRYGCILPWYLGVRTFVLLRQTPPLETNQRVKVSRSEVRAVLALALPAALSNTILRRMRRALL